MDEITPQAQVRPDTTEGFNPGVPTHYVFCEKSKPKPKEEEKPSETDDFHDKQDGYYGFDPW
ncbi:MAG: hypothetical protein GY862_37675 [Gammaproteobacteria bacterium]|nr:hypothetical protein [Gammaproteobacteria bacterium]